MAILLIIAYFEIRMADIISYAIKKNLAFGSMTLKNNYFNSIRPLHNGQIILDVPPLWNSLPPGEKSFITLAGISNCLLQDGQVSIVRVLGFCVFFLFQNIWDYLL